jgi:hypothetical protein
VLNLGRIDSVDTAYMCSTVQGAENMRGALTLAIRLSCCMSYRYYAQVRLLLMLAYFGGVLRVYIPVRYSSDDCEFSFLPIEILIADS